MEIHHAGWNATFNYALSTTFKSVCRVHQLRLPSLAAPDAEPGEKTACDHVSKVCSVTQKRYRTGQNPDGGSAVYRMGTLANDLIERLVPCSGKVYYDLLKLERWLILKLWVYCGLNRYILSRAGFERKLTPYRKYQEVVWCQEEQ